MTYDFDFRKAETIQDLALFLGIDQARFESAVSAGQSPSDDDGIYFRHRIPKKNKAKGYRTVWDVVDTDIRDAHRAFARRFADFALFRYDEAPFRGLCCIWWPGGGPIREANQDRRSQ